ncbi:MAG: DUF6084 family protein [Rhodococcus sp. (in: high G+C Gram-positive bacteria)]|uniref:DUF6084 family protein n=1 Tax=Rhodococcus sp. TaxID=1831 RepID=UPI003BB068ED
MTEVSFEVLDVSPEPFAVAPNLTARVRVTESTESVVHAMAVRCQVRIDPGRRRYTDLEARGLLDLFGSRERWASTLKPFQWMETSTVAQGFTGSSVVDLPLPCTYDFEVTASKYLHALEVSGSTVPLIFLFSGTVFTRGATGFGVERIPWDREAVYDLPVTAWRDLVRAHFPNTGWLRLDRDTLAALARYKSERGLLGLDAAIADLLQGAGEVMS